MEKYGHWSEQENTKFRTSGDNKELTITPPTSLTGASLILTLPDVSGTADTLVSATSTTTLTNKTLTAPVISTIVNTGTLTLPTSTDTLVGQATTDTLTNKTIDGDTNTIQDLALSTLKTTANLNVFVQRDGTGNVIDSTKAVPSGDVVGSSDAQTLTNKTIDGDTNTVQDLALSTLKTTANLNVFVQRDGTGNVIDSTKTVPSGDVVGSSDSQTLTNKTLTAPVISTIVNTGTLTLPTSTDTLIGRATTDTLTNKTIDGDTNTVQDLALTSLKTTANLNVFVQRDGTGAVIDSAKSVPTGEVIGSSDTQTLTNKTIDGDNNTVQDLALTSLKTTANLNVFVQRDGSGIVVDSSKSVPTGDVVGSSDSQTVTNKVLSAFTYDDTNVSITANAIAKVSQTIHRITAGTGPLNTMSGAADGDVKILVNELGTSLTVTNDSGAGGFIIGTGLDLTLEDDASITVIYNATSLRWQVIGGAGAGGGLSLENIAIAGTLEANKHYLVDSSGGAFTLTLPAGTTGAVIRVSDVSNSWDTNNVTLDGDGAETIDSDTTLICDVEGAWVQLMWNGTEWKTDDPFVPSAVDLTGDLSVDGHIYLPVEDGSGNFDETDPAYSFTGDTDTGMFSSAADTLNFSTGGVNQLTLSSTGDLALNNGSITYDAADTTGNIISGTYTPTISNTTNVSVSAARVNNYMRVGNIVTISGFVNITTTASGDTTFEINLPVASNFTSVDDASGAGAITAVGDGIPDAEFSTISGYASITNDAIKVTGYFANTSTKAVSYVFQYVVR
jgi:hypothetical protein